jgi:hypothetical protein
MKRDAWPHRESIPPGFLMKITVHGAAGGEVTGSAYLVQTRDANVLVNLGPFQGAPSVGNSTAFPGRERSP